MDKVIKEMQSKGLISIENVANVILMANTPYFKVESTDFSKN